jgi:hypothetical protein
MGCLKSPVIGPLDLSVFCSLLVAAFGLAEFVEESCAPLGFLSEVWMNLGGWVCIKLGLSGSHHFRFILHIAKGCTILCLSKPSDITSIPG